MILHFNVAGDQRKKLVKAIENNLGIKAKYLGMPTAAYQIGEYTVTRDGALTWNETSDVDQTVSEQTSNMIDACVMEGFEPEEWESVREQEIKSKEQEGENAEQETEIQQEEETGLTVQMPLDKVNVDNLTRLLEAKGRLIKKAMGIEELPFLVTETEISFPWFAECPDENEVKAFTDFIAAICKMSREQKRINATEKEVSNEKYAFRCFLLRLGFIGTEYKTDRKILLKNLTGSSAFKTVKETASNEISE